eukprot:3641677-Prymnesium_polylepis.1
MTVGFTAPSADLQEVPDRSVKFIHTLITATALRRTRRPGAGEHDPAAANARSAHPAPTSGAHTLTAVRPRRADRIVLTAFRTRARRRTGSDASRAPRVSSWSDELPTIRIVAAARGPARASGNLAAWAARKAETLQRPRDASWTPGLDASAVNVNETNQKTKNPNKCTNQRGDVPARRAYGCSRRTAPRAAGEGPSVCPSRSLDSIDVTCSCGADRGGTSA